MRKYEIVKIVKKQTKKILKIFIIKLYLKLIMKKKMILKEN